MNKKYIVKQSDIKDCGICCLESIIKYYKGYVPLETLRLDTKTNNNGTTAYNLIKTAKKYGFNAIGRKVLNIDQEHIILPAIAHIVTEKGFNHFIVIYKITKDAIYVMDPSTGYKKYSKKDFLKQWTNIILIFKPYKQIPLYTIKDSLKELILEIIKKESKLISSLILTNITITIFSIIISYHFQITLSLIENSYITSIIFVTTIFLFFNILKIYYNYIKNNLTIYLNKNIDLHTIPMFIKHIINLPLNVITSRTTGEIITRVQDLNNIKNLFSEVLISIILDTFLTVCSAIFLFNISSKLFFILCIISLLNIIVCLLTNPILNRKINDNIESETTFNGELSDTIESLESIKNLNLTKESNNNIEEKYCNYVSSIFHSSKFLNILETIYTCINDLGLFIISSYGIFLIINNKLSLLSLITFNSLVSYFLEPIKNLINISPNYYQIKLSYIKILEFLNNEEEHLGKKEQFINGDITFENIIYSYNDYNNILKNISLTIKENNHYIFKGPTGSGKSTLLKMLNHNIKDYKGTIKIADINIKDYSLNTLRSNILYVSQKEKIFNDTIYQNITLNKKVSKKELNNIINLTKVDEIINKKTFRLDSYLYDSGSNLSGGERQRIILARSLIMKPKILILDESLSEVDDKTENEILANIDKYLKNTTIIYISHTNTTYFKNTIDMEYLNEK